MHDFDVTYSLAVPERHPLAADRLRTYRVVHDALVEVLADLGIEASLFACGTPGLGCGEREESPARGAKSAVPAAASRSCVSSVGPRATCW